MSPTILSPTPIKGIQNADGKQPLGQRLPLAELQKNDFAFALYVQALLAWQQDGDEDKDSDNKTGTSYFQVTGIHGIPFTHWQKDPTKFVSPSGYCTHRSVLFVPWHRPYLLLYEQIIYQYALDIVENSTGYAKQAYEAVLDSVRLPYWDFSKDSSLPEVVQHEGLDIVVPGDSEGEKKTLHLDHNPFYSYQFTSFYAWGIVAERLGWTDWEGEWSQETRRCPDKNGDSHPEIANKQMQTVGKDYRARAYGLLTSVNDFAEFTTQAWKGPDTNYDSVEVWHNYVHNYSGTLDAHFDQFKPFPEKYNRDFVTPSGNLTDVQASSFDPLFWLLHCHIDRMTAIWQALNYQSTKINELPSWMPRATAVKGTKENGSSHLEPWYLIPGYKVGAMQSAHWTDIVTRKDSLPPAKYQTPMRNNFTNWHNSDKHDTSDYWIADDTKDLDSTFKYGYYYPETPPNLRNDGEFMKEHVKKQINELYAPSRVLKLIREVAEAGTLQENVSAALSTEPQETVTSSALKPITSVEWRAFVRVKSFAVSGAWGIHLFFGEPPAESSTWFMSDQRVGTVNILANSNINSCSNCKSQAEADLLVTGLVLLSNELEKRNIDIDDQDAVVQYLKENLTWRIAKDAKNVEILPDMKLTVGVASRDVAYPLSAADLPVWGEARIFPAATEGKAGGLEQGAGEL